VIFRERRVQERPAAFRKRHGAWRIWVGKVAGHPMPRSSFPDLPGPSPPAIRPSLRLLLRVWLALGVQSFGGGAATLALIRQAVVDRHGWLTPAEFARQWALCHLAPGMNLLALTILIGRQLAGAPGAAVALLGLLLPSVGITVLLTALYALVQNAHLVQAALRGVVPASVGLGLIAALHLARPLLQASRQEGGTSLLVSAALLLGGGLVLALWNPPVLLILWTAGALGALAAMMLRRRPQPDRDGGGS
jgi:chromate transporter